MTMTDLTAADTESLRSRLARKPIVVAPGVYDAFTALVAAQAGFTTLYLSGAAIAYTRLGRPDIGLVSMSEVAGTLALIRDRVDAHLIVDADTGYGNAINVVRTVRAFEQAGASAIQLEDQDFPKRCGHLDGKALVSSEEMCGKIHAAVDSRRSADTLVIARTDAVAVEGFERAVERATRYAEAGADMLFVEAPKARDDLARIVTTLAHVPAKWTPVRRQEHAPLNDSRACSDSEGTEHALGGKLPLMANMVEGGKTPPLSAAELELVGFALVIFPGGIVRAFGRMATDYYASLATHGTTEPYRTRMLDFDGLNALIGTPEMLALGKSYETPAPAPDSKTGTRR
jgi:2-methylisocitrate lyase-like PEP mutase family enzyme